MTSSLSLPSAVFKSLSIYGSRDTLYVVGFDEVCSAYKVLLINRPLKLVPGDSLDIDVSNKQFRDKTELATALTNSKCDLLFSDVRCLFGIVRLAHSYYLVVVTAASTVASIHGHEVHQISSVEYIPVIYRLRNTIDETQYRNMVTARSLYEGLYFSYTYDLSNKFQDHALSTVIPVSNDKNSLRLNDRFVWNYFALFPLMRVLTQQQSKENSADTSSSSSIRPFIVPIIHGYIEERLVPLGATGTMTLVRSAKAEPDKEEERTTTTTTTNMRITLIGRRSRHFAGVRYLRRGVTVDGNVANEVESEQLVTIETKEKSSSPPPAFLSSSSERNGRSSSTTSSSASSSSCSDSGEQDSSSTPYRYSYRTSSFVQVRGSIPLYWSHKNIFMPNPDIVIWQPHELLPQTRPGVKSNSVTMSRESVAAKALEEKEANNSRAEAAGAAPLLSSSREQQQQQQVMERQESAKGDQQQSVTEGEHYHSSSCGIRSSSSESDNKCSNKLHPWSAVIAHFKDLSARYGANIRVITLLREKNSEREILLSGAFHDLCRQIQKKTSADENEKVLHDDKQLSGLSFAFKNFDVLNFMWNKEEKDEGEEAVTERGKDQDLIKEKLGGNAQTSTAEGMRSKKGNSSEQKKVAVFEKLLSYSKEYIHETGFFVQCPPAIISKETYDGSTRSISDYYTSFHDLQGKGYLDLVSTTRGVGQAGGFPDDAIEQVNMVHKQEDSLETGLNRGVLQCGVIRTNCVDCLDRTNISQFVNAKYALQMQMKSLGVKDLSQSSMRDLFVLCMDIWVRHGDQVSQQYGGSEAMHKIISAPLYSSCSSSLSSAQVVSSSKSGAVVGSSMATTPAAVAVATGLDDDIKLDFSLSGGSKNAFIAAKRYVSNISVDFERQRAIDVLLGVYQCRKEVVEPVWSTSQSSDAARQQSVDRFYEWAGDVEGTNFDTLSPISNYGRMSPLQKEYQKDRKEKGKTVVSADSKAGTVHKSGIDEELEELLDIKATSKPYHIFNTADIKETANQRKLFSLLHSLPQSPGESSDTAAAAAAGAGGGMLDSSGSTPRFFAVRPTEHGGERVCYDDEDEAASEPLSRVAQLLKMFVCF